MRPGRTVKIERVENGFIVHLDFNGYLTPPTSLVYQDLGAMFQEVANHLMPPRGCTKVMVEIADPQEE